MGFSIKDINPKDMNTDLNPSADDASRIQKLKNFYRRGQYLLSFLHVQVSLTSPRSMILEAYLGLAYTVVQFEVNVVDDCWEAKR